VARRVGRRIESVARDLEVSRMPGSLRKRLLVLAMAALGACGGDGGSGGPDATAVSSGAGTLSVKLTDAPAAAEHANVFVTIERISVHRAGTDDAAGAGWSEIVLDPPRKIDLLTLRNGATVALGELQLAEGGYTQLRLVLGQGPADNTIVLASNPGVEIPMRMPTGVRDGLKLIHPFRVGAGETVELTLDFDAARSVVMSGTPEIVRLKPTPQVSATTGGEMVSKPAIAADDSGQRVNKPATAVSTDSGGADPRPLLKPSIAVIPTISDGMPASGAVAGAFDDDSANGATVSLQAYDAVNDTVVVKRSTVVDGRRWALDPVPPGSGYQLVIAKTGYRTVVLTGVDVAAGAAIGPVSVGALEAATSLRAASGRFDPADGSAGKDARVRALQRVGAGADGEVVVEVAATMTPVATGAFALTLPVDAAKVARFAASPLAFAAGANAARYLLEADGLGDSTGDGVLTLDAVSVGQPGSLAITARR
jgi:hypothetical protein